MAYTKKSGEAVDRYVKKNYDTLSLRGKKGFREELQSHAALTGESVNAFICRAIRETMERDKKRIAELMKQSRSSE